MKKMTLITFFTIVLSIYANNLVVDAAKSKNLSLDKAANGVPLVNIEKPNSDGLSHNIFKEYNVGKEGIILNNATYFETTKLGGIVYGNPNLQSEQKQASTILTEVSGVNRSKLEGFTEIAGKQADYILANPNGIYVDGAGFINTGNITLSTGSADKLLNPEKGNIEITGKGLDLRNIDKSELIARTAELTAPIYGGNEVNIKLGSKGESKKPEYALDARALGSIYAGRINIISTEEGVGVKSDSLVYAEKGNLIIDSKGKVYLNNAQAKENINIKSKKTEVQEKLVSEKKIDIVGDTKNFGEIRSNEELNIKGSLENNKQVVSNSKINISGDLKNTNEVKTRVLNSNNISNSGDLLISDKVKTNDITNTGNILIANEVSAKNIKNLGRAKLETKILNSNNLENSGNIEVEEVKNKASLINTGKILVNTLSSEEIKNNKELTVNNNLKSEKLINLEEGILKTESTKIKDIENSGKIKSRDIEASSIENLGNVESEKIKLKNIRNSGNIVSNILINAEVLNNSRDGKIETKDLSIDEVKNQGIINAEDIKNASLINTGKVISRNLKTNEIETAGEISAVDSISSNKLLNFNKGSVITENLNVIDIENQAYISSKNLENNILKNSGKIITNDLNTKIITNEKDIVVNNYLNSEKLVNLSKGVLKTEVLNAKNIENLGSIKSRNLESSLMQNTGKVGAEEVSLEILKNNGEVEATKKLNLDFLTNKTEGKIKTSDLKSKEIENQGEINSKNILNTNLINTGKIVTQNLDTRIIETNGEIIAVGELRTDDLLSLNNSKISAKKLNTLNIQNVGNISAEEIENKNLVNKGYISSNDINSKEIKNDNSISASKSLKADQVLNYSTGNINSAKTDVKKIENSGEIKAGEITSDSIINIGNIDSNESINSKILENNESGKVKAKVLNVKEVNNQGSVNTESIDNKILINTGELISKNLKSEDIENAGQINVQEKIEANNLLALESSNIIAKNLNTINIENVGSINAEEIKNKNLVNKGSIISNNLNSEEIKNDNKIVTNKNLNTNKITNYATGNIGAESANITEIENKGKINSKNIKNSNLVNTGVVVSENLNSKNINNTNAIVATKELVSEKLKNTNTAEIYSANLSAKNIENLGNLEAIKLSSDEILNTGKVLTKDTNIRSINNQNSFIAIDSINSKSIDNSGILKTKELSSEEILNKSNLSAKNIKTTDIDNSGKILVENLNTKNLINKKDVELSNNLTTNLLINKENSRLSAKNIKAQNIENKAELKANNNLEASTIKNSNKLLVGNKLDVKKLSNTSKVEAKDIEIKESLINENGKINAENIDILTAKIDNKTGEILAKNNINIDIPNEKLVLDGTYVADNKLDIRAKKLINNVNLENNGSLALNIDDDLVNNNKIKAGNRLNIKVKNLTNNNELGAISSLNIESDNFINTGSTNFGTDSNNLKVKNDIDNTGFIHSLGELNISANDIANKGQIASVGNLKINANNIENRALIYSSEDIDVKFKGNFKNEKADIYSGGNFTAIGAGDFENKLGDITSIGDIKIEAENIRNIGEVTGNHKIVGKQGLKDINIDKSELDSSRARKAFSEIKIYSSDRIYGEISADSFDKIESNYISTLSNIKSDKNINLKSLNELENREGYISANDNINIEAKKLKNISFIKNVETDFLWKLPVLKKYCYTLGSGYSGGHDGSQRDDKEVCGWEVDKILTYKDTITQYVGADKPSKIFAGKKLNIKAENIGNGLFKENSVSNIDRKNVNVESIILNKKNIDKREALNTSNYIFIPDEEINEKDEFVSTNENIKKNDEALFYKDKAESQNKEINISSSELYKANSFESNKEKIESLNESNISQREDFKNELSKIKKDEMSTAGKGLFKLNKIDDFSNKPGFSYLIETNLKFLDKSLYLGSEYFFKQLNFSPDRNIRLLGDSFYETRLINKTILEGTGRRYLHSFKTEKEQMKYLYDNGVKAARDLNLSLGVALTKEQIDKLNQDLIWYVEEEVRGIKVLVPKLYISNKTYEALKNNKTGLEAGEELNITTNSLINTGSINADNMNISSKSLVNKSLSENIAYIEGRNIKLNIEDSLDNIGANIKAKENIIINSDGDILNTATYRVNKNIEGIVKSKLENISKIEAGSDLVIQGKNIKNIASKIISGNDMVLSADEIDIENLKLEDKISKKYNRVDIKNKGSEITSAGNTLIKANKEINVKGSNISADKNLTLEADNISVEAVENSFYEKHGGGKNYTIKKGTENLKSSLSGENLNIKAQDNINIKASDIKAKENLNIAAGGDIDIVSATDSQYFEKMESKKKKFGGRKSKHEISYSSQNVASNIVGNNINIESGKDVSILGSNIQAGVEGETNIKAQGDITQAGVKDIDYSYSKKSKSRFGGLISKSTTKENMQESAIKSAAVAGNKGLVYDSKNDLLLEGVNVVSTGNIKLKGDNVIISPIETESYNKVKKEKKGFGGSLSPTSVSLSYGKDKFSSDAINKVENPSEITSSKNIDIEASNKVNAKAANIYAKEDINISGDKGVEFSAGTNSQERKIKQSSTKANIGLSVKSEIVDTIENIKNVDKLVDFSGDSYSVLNTASNLVGAIRTGADAVNTVVSDKVKDGVNSGKSSNWEGINTNPKDYINLTAGVTKSKSEIKTYDESAVKNSIEGKDININSKEGSVVLEGTDIKAKNLSLEAKENLEIKAADERHKSSNKSSSSGLSASISASETPITLTASASGAKGRGSGTSYVNSIIEVKEKLKTESENLKISGANIETDKIDIKAKDIVIESKQDESERKDSSFGGSITLTANPTMPIKDLSINGSKGKGESEWVNNQTTVIAKNGGSIEAENKLANTGAVLGSLNKDEKLKISAKEIEVKDLEDKDKYENKGGGISVGFDGMKPKVPNVSVIHDKADKEQINRATAINTEITLNGEKVEAEDLGFNTDISKSQEKIKDEEKHLNAKLHTDLLNESEQNKLKYAGKKLGAFAKEINDTNKFKESLFGIAVDKYKDENQKQFNLIKDENLTEQQILKTATDIVTEFFKSIGYKGKIPEINLTNQEKSFSIDSLDKETGERRTEKVYFSIAQIRDKNLDFSQLMTHELAHMNTYDEGFLGEETALHTRKQVGSENKNKKMSEKEKAEYLAKIENRYESKDINKMYEEANQVAESAKEYFLDKKTYEKYKNPNLTKEEIKKISKEYKVSEKEVENNKAKYVYYDTLKTKNREFKNEKELLVYQEELRNKINLEQDIDKRKELSKGLYVEMPNSAALYHNIKIDKKGEPYIDTTFPNKKYVNYIGQEAVFNKETGEWIKDGINDATYNIAVWEKDYKINELNVHFKQDVDLWKNYGVGPHDKLTKTQRENIDSTVIWTLEASKETYHSLKKDIIDSLDIISEIENF